MKISEMTALNLSSEIKSGKIKIREALDCVYSEIEANEKNYNCYITLCKDEAYKQADEIQAKIDAGAELSPLAGVPIAVKDNICTKGIKTTCASKILENYIPTYNATVITKIKAAGMIIIGKVNMDEFAMGSTTETSAAGVTSNPNNTAYVPGGSSGGSAAGVAANEAFIALGSDTGGSIRQPSSFCGVTGLKPTYGTVSRWGLVAFASSLDQIGPIGKDVEDCAALYSIICGRDEHDSTSMDMPEFDFSYATSGNIKGKKVGVPREFFGEGLNEEVKSAVLCAINKFKELGAEVEEFDMPIVKYAIPTYYIIACAEACSNLSRYDGIKYGYSTKNAEDLLETYVKSRSEGFGMEVKRRIMLGNFVLSSGYYDAYYKKALQAKKLIHDSFETAFKEYDMLLGPVYPTTAPKKGESLSDPLKMYLGDIYTVMVNIAGIPAVSVPCAKDKNGLPIGLQILGNSFGEAEILNAGCAYQNAAGKEL